MCEKKEGVGFFQEDVGSSSMMRLMCLISLLASVGFGALTLLIADPVIVSAGVVLALIFLIGAFAPKAIQKFAEVKLEEILKK